MSTPSKWDDLKVRVLSGIAVLAIGVLAIWIGDWAIRCLSVVVAGLMLWELSRLTAPAQPQTATAIGALAAGSMALIFWFHGAYWLVLLLLPSILGLITPRRDRLIYAIYAFAIMLACYAFVAFREGYGLAFTLWLVLVVIASDVMGYFGGRIIGGPKFWPRVSPKKTWSGTIAGWLGAALVGLGFALADGEPMILVLFSALAAFAAQMGDIAESAIKRRAGVKDSSALIPGHGGLLDRFDAMIGAAVFVILWGLVRLPLPDFGG